MHDRLFNLLHMVIFRERKKERKKERKDFFPSRFFIVAAVESVLLSLLVFLLWRKKQGKAVQTSSVIWILHMWYISAPFTTGGDICKVWQSDSQTRPVCDDECFIYVFSKIRLDCVTFQKLIFKFWNSHPVVFTISLLFLLKQEAVV